MFTAHPNPNVFVFYPIFTLPVVPVYSLHSSAFMLSSVSAQDRQINEHHLKDGLRVCTWHLHCPKLVVTHLCIPVQMCHTILRVRVSLKLNLLCVCTWLECIIVVEQIECTGHKCLFSIVVNFTCAQTDFNSAWSFISLLCLSDMIIYSH